MKTTIGTSTNKKSLHNLGHDVSTTSNFGFCQPILCRELIPQDSVDLSIGQMVRLNPLVVPTFGEVKLKTYSSFVKTEDIFHPFAALMLGKPYKGSSGVSYIPENVPQVPLKVLYEFLVRNSEVYMYLNDEVDNGVLYNNDNEWINTIPSFDEQALFQGSLNDYFSGVDVDWTNYLAHLINLGFSEHSSGGLTFYRQAPNAWDTSSPDSDSFDWLMAGPNNQGEDEDKQIYFCGRFNRSARLLRKILVGLGYKFVNSTEPVSLLPIVAYYKVWFDLFAVQRDKTWKDTPAFSLMEYLEQSGNYLVGSTDWTSDTYAPISFAQLMAELSACFYTINPDYASAHIGSVATDSAISPSIDYLDNNAGIQYVEQNDPGLNVFDSGAGDSSVGRKIQDIMTVYVNKLTAIGGRIGAGMRSLYQSDYNDIVDSTYLGSQVTDIQIGPVFSTNENMSDGNVTLALGEFAGQGYGDNRDPKSRRDIKFTAKSSGYLITLITIVPDSKMSQGVDPNLFHCKRADFYLDKLDGKTLLPTRKMCIYGNQEIIDGDVNIYNGGFGNIPIYTEYKVKDNILNGDMSLPSRRSTYLPFTLDKLLPFRNKMPLISTDGFDLLKNVPASLITSGDFWRKIGLQNWFGNFDRIFINSGNAEDLYYVVPEDDIDDNFIIHNYVNLKIYSRALPLADSFDTGAFEGDSMQIEKS